MSQWGPEREINGARFVPLFDSAAFREAPSSAAIVDILLVDDGGEPMRAARMLRALRRAALEVHAGAWSTLRLGC